MYTTRPSQFALQLGYGLPSIPYRLPAFLFGTGNYLHEDTHVSYGTTARHVYNNAYASCFLDQPLALDLVDGYNSTKPADKRPITYDAPNTLSYYETYVLGRPVYNYATAALSNRYFSAPLAGQIFSSTDVIEAAPSQSDFNAFVAQYNDPSSGYFVVNTGYAQTGDPSLDGLLFLFNSVIARNRPTQHAWQLVRYEYLRPLGYYPVNIRCSQLGWRRYGDDDSVLYDNGRGRTFIRISDGDEAVAVMPSQSPYGLTVWLKPGSYQFSAIWSDNHIQRQDGAWTYELSRRRGACTVAADDYASNFVDLR